MSDNQPTRPNWADKANLASNLLQNIQLHELHSTLRAAGALQAEQMRLAVSERQTTENEDRLREHIWQMESAFNRKRQTGYGAAGEAVPEPLGCQRLGNTSLTSWFFMVGKRPSTSVKYSCGLMPRRRQL